MHLRTVAILRAFDPDKSRELALRCWEIGIDLVEVPVQGEAGWASLTAESRMGDLSVQAPCSPPRIRAEPPPSGPR